MKNLKKVLALVMAFAMAFTMMASAAYTDSADIKATEAVDTLTALGVMSGDPNGSFRPNDTITRAEACRIIYTIRSGGNSDASAYAGMQTTFTDVPANAWYAGYVKHCQSVGIVSGKSAKIFDPNAPVTGVELALMSLRVMGYDPVKADIGGSTWSMRTIGLATEAGILDDVNTSIEAACPRQYAAQIMYNMIDANTVRWSDDAKDYVDENLAGRALDTVGKKYMSLNKAVGTMTDFKKTSGKSTFEATLTNIDANASDSALTANLTSSQIASLSLSYSKITKDYSELKYKQVKVLYKEKDEVYGIFATEDNTVKTGLLKKLEMDGAKVKLDGTKYDLANTTSVYVNGDKMYMKAAGSGTGGAYVAADFSNSNSAPYTLDATIQKWVDVYGDGADGVKYTNGIMQGTEVQLLATDGSTNFSILKVTTHAVGKVTAVGSDYINVTKKGGDPAVITNTKLENDDWNYSDLKKDDYVVVTAGGNYADGNGRVEKATVVSGKVTGTKSDDGVSIGGEWYTMAGAGLAMVKRPNTGSNVDMVVVNGYVYFTDTKAGSIDDVALLVEAAASGGTGSKWEARLILADGTDKTVQIEKFWGDKDNKAHPIGTITEANGGILVSYEVSNNVYTLTQLGAQSISDNALVANEYETAGYDIYADTADTLTTDGSVKAASGDSIDTLEADGDTGALTRMYYESTGVVFVKHKASVAGDDADYKVVTGKVAADYDKTLAAAGFKAVANKSGNSYYAQVAFIDLGAGSTGGSSDKYAVVTGDVIKSTSNGTIYEIPAWNGSEAITIKTDNSAAKNLAKGSLFTFSGSTDAADIEVKATVSANAYYVSAYDKNSGDISLLKKSAANTFYALNNGVASDKYDKIDSKDTVVLYVNSDDGSGVASGEIDLQYYFDSDFWTTVPTVSGTGKTTPDNPFVYAGGAGLTEDDAPNVVAFFDDSDNITAIVVDVNRNITEW